MIFHLSFAVSRPAHVAAVLAELTGGSALPAPTPPFPYGSWLLCCGDDAGTMLELLPSGFVLDPNAPLGLGREPASQRSACHALVATPHTHETVLAIAEREGWLAQRVESGLFEIVKVWIENGFLLEFIGPEQAARYSAAFGRAGLPALGGKLRELEKALAAQLASRLSAERLAEILGKPAAA